MNKQTKPPPRTDNFLSTCLLFNLILANRSHHIRVITEVEETKPQRESSILIEECKKIVSDIIATESKWKIIGAAGMK